MAPPRLAFHDLGLTVKGKDGGPKAIVQGISASIAGRRVVAIMGPSGAGKTTLLCGPAPNAAPATPPRVVRAGNICFPAILLSASFFPAIISDRFSPGDTGRSSRSARRKARSPAWRWSTVSPSRRRGSAGRAFTSAARAAFDAGPRPPPRIDAGPRPPPRIASGPSPRAAAPTRPPTQLSQVAQGDDESTWPTLTPREQITYATAMFTATACKKGQGAPDVDDLLKRLGLESCADTVAGASAAREIFLIADFFIGGRGGAAAATRIFRENDAALGVDIPRGRHDARRPRVRPRRPLGRPETTPRGRHGFGQARGSDLPRRTDARSRVATSPERGASGPNAVQASAEDPRTRRAGRASTPRPRSRPARRSATSRTTVR